MKKVLHSQSKWQWFGHPAHWICGHQCTFHLATRVGPWMVSTVGEWRPDGYDTEAHPIGGNVPKGKKDFYETMVFPVKPGTECAVKGCRCGAPKIDVTNTREQTRTATRGEAQETHLRLCHEYSRKANP